VLGEQLEATRMNETQAPGTEASLETESLAYDAIPLFIGELCLGRRIMYWQTATRDGNGY
jgi:hypothetical protein